MDASPLISFKVISREAFTKASVVQEKNLRKIPGFELFYFLKINMKLSSQNLCCQFA